MVKVGKKKHLKHFVETSIVDGSSFKTKDTIR